MRLPVDGHRAGLGATLTGSPPTSASAVLGAAVRHASDAYSRFDAPRHGPSMLAPHNRPPPPTGLRRPALSSRESHPRRPLCWTHVRHPDPDTLGRASHTR